VSHAGPDPFQPEQTAKTVVSAGAELIERAMRDLESDIQAAREQESAQKIIKQMRSEV